MLDSNRLLVAELQHLRSLLAATRQDVQLTGTLQSRELEQQRMLVLELLSSLQPPATEQVAQLLGPPLLPTSSRS